MPDLETATLAGGILDVGTTFRADGGDMSGGILTGAGTLTTDGALTWSGGTMSGTGKTVVSLGATLTLSSTNYKDLSRVLEVQGVADYTGSNLRFGVSQDSPGTIHTTTSGVFNAIGEGDFGIIWGAAHAIVNEGAFTRSGTGTTTVHSGITFTSSDTAEVKEGTLQLAGGGTDSGTLLGPGIIEFSGGTHTAGFGGRDLRCDERPR